MSDELSVSPSAKDLYKRSLLAVTRRQDEVRRRGRFEVGDLFDLSGELVRRLQQSEQLNSYAVYYFDPRDVARSHAVNVTIFSVMLASGMGRSFDEQVRLAAAGLLHDVGIGGVPQAVLNKDAKLLSRLERRQAEEHSRLGEQAILESDPQLQEIATSTYQHHERMNGSGYPQRLKSDQISSRARILAIIDTYEALIHPRNHHDALIPPSGIRELLSQRGTSFDPALLKQMIEHISIYPRGCYMELNSQQIGKVVRTNRRNPLRPVVRLLYDSKGNAIKSQSIDLAENPLLSIRKCLPPPGWKRIA